MCQDADQWSPIPTSELYHPVRGWGQVAILDALENRHYERRTA